MWSGSITPKVGLIELPKSPIRPDLKKHVQKVAKTGYHGYFCIKFMNPCLHSLKALKLLPY